MMGKTTSFSKSQLARAHYRLQKVLASDVPVMPSSGGVTAQAEAPLDTVPTGVAVGKPLESKR